MKRRLVAKIQLKIEEEIDNKGKESLGFGVLDVQLLHGNQTIGCFDVTDSC